jgi:nucleoside-diphosphate-sugar epimerase
LTRSYLPGESVPQAPDGVRGQILSLLASGLAKEDGHETVDGRDVIDLAAQHTNATLDTDPQHYYDHLNVPGTENMY